ncbi:MAG: 4Fe-4S dicluster domain-containing protein [Deltaproteobacteria bacterium]|nr:4Fe-4S dicluster domain-containing protein [Deltaproteobacteria bacterium]
MANIVRVNPGLGEEVQRFGADDVAKCYHCGNCSATCPMSKEPFLIPRKSMRYLQMGADERLRGNLEPWLCYYCGECSDQCPRGAEPGETMMSLRRWLTAQYDFTGISRLFYRSAAVEVGAVVVLGLLTGIGFYLAGTYLGGGDLNIYDGPRAFLPAYGKGGSFFSFGGVHTFDWAMGVLLAGLLGINCLRMWYFTMFNDQAPKVGIGAYISKLWVLPWHFISQRRYSECDKKTPWLVHLIMMLSYLTMLILIMFFLHSVHYGPEIVWQAHAFGYLATVGLLFGTVYAMYGRANKVNTYHKHSHASDWLFPVLIFYCAVTGIAQHIAHRTGFPALANVIYIIHMMGVVPMLVLEVPFGKWSHLAYRPLAIYFAEVQSPALLAQARARQSAPATARAA